jgi:hypothetical protein
MASLKDVARITQSNLAKRINQLENFANDREQRDNTNRSDLEKRWRNKNYVPQDQVDRGVKPRPAEPKSISSDVTHGNASYDRSKHSNKYANNANVYEAKGKTNYVYAYQLMTRDELGLLDEASVKNQAKAGFNAGQINGYKKWNKITDRYGTPQGRGLSQDIKRSAVNALISVFDTEGNLDAEIESIKEKIYDVIQPGLTRLPVTFMARISLDKLLKQNTLLPTDGVLNAARKVNNTNTTFHGFNTGFQDIQKTFDNLYISSSATPVGSVGTTNNRFRKGLISGVPVVDLEEPISEYRGGAIRQLSGTEVFTFKDDDAKYLTYQARHRGFYSNIKGNVFGDTLPGSNGTQSTADSQDPGGKLLPAVFHSEETADNAAHSLANSDAQFFPFMFETVNRSTQVGDGTEKGSVFEQFAFFQATLSQLQENFVPNWSSKQFMGRTEEVHTYQHTGRTMDIRFIIFANSLRELQNVYERVNWLSQQTYPMYDENVGGPSRMSNGPIIRITVGDMFRRIPGFIRNLSYNWDHLGANKWEVTRGARMPMSCEVSLSFQVLHDYMPDRNTDFYEGLKTMMVTGGRDIPVATEESPLNKRAYDPETNLIPVKIPRSGKFFGDAQESYVTLLARQRVRGGEDIGFSRIDANSANAIIASQNARAQDPASQYGQQASSVPSDPLPQNITDLNNQVGEDPSELDGTLPPIRNSPDESVFNKGGLVS